MQEPQKLANGACNEQTKGKVEVSNRWENVRHEKNGGHVATYCFPEQNLVRAHVASRAFCNRLPARFQFGIKLASEWSGHSLPEYH